MVPTSAEIYKHLFETLEITRYDTSFIKKHASYREDDPLKNYIFRILEVLGISAFNTEVVIGSKEVAIWYEGNHPIEDRAIVTKLPANAQAFVRFWDTNANI